MLKLWKAKDRGSFHHGWLDTRHTFSFGEFYDPQKMGFRALRVINEDWVSPGMGFGMHPHRDMEIITCVLEGALQHKDSMGHGAVLRPGEFQHMTAGTGIRHSEFNPSQTETVHLYQIWLLPRASGLKPSYNQKAYPLADRTGRFQLVASPDGSAGSLTIQQDTRISLGHFDPGQKVACPLETGHYGWLQILSGEFLTQSMKLGPGDALALENEAELRLETIHPGELLWFDLT
jgi:redox-sensitive bicupin YhaK (pirin superfamily)